MVYKNGSFASVMLGVWTKAAADRKLTEALNRARPQWFPLAKGISFSVAISRRRHLRDSFEEGDTLIFASAIIEAGGNTALTTWSPSASVNVDFESTIIAIVYKPDRNNRRARGTGVVHARCKRCPSGPVSAVANGLRHRWPSSHAQL
jgi:hypothetical protein